MPHVVIIGGGVAGLHAALTLAERSKGCVEVTLLEKEGRFGGRIRHESLQLSDDSRFSVAVGAAYLHGLQPDTNGEFIQMLQRSSAIDVGLEHIESRETPKVWLLPSDSQSENSVSCVSAAQQALDQLERMMWEDDLSLHIPSEDGPLQADTTYEDWISELHLSRLGGRYLESLLCKDEGSDAARMGVLDHYLCQSQWRFGDSFSFINIGFSRLVRWMVERLSKMRCVRLFRFAQVTAIRPHPHSHAGAPFGPAYQVLVHSQGEQFTVHCNHVICATPKQALKSMDMSELRIPRKVCSSMNHLECGRGAKMIFEITVECNGGDSSPLPSSESSSSSFSWDDCVSNNDSFLVICVDAFVSELQFLHCESASLHSHLHESATTTSTNERRFVLFGYFVGDDFDELYSDYNAMLSSVEDENRMTTQREIMVNEWKTGVCVRITELLNRHWSEHGCTVRLGRGTHNNDAVFACWNEYTYVIPTVNSCYHRRIIREFNHRNLNLTSNQECFNNVFFIGEYLSSSFGAVQESIDVAHSVSLGLIEKLFGKG